MRKTLCEALHQLLNNEGTQEDWAIVLKELQSLIKVVSAKLTQNLKQKLKTEEINSIHEVICRRITKVSVDDCLYELSLNILTRLIKTFKQRPILKSEILYEKKCYGFIGTIIKNYLIDLWRHSKTEVETTVEIESSDDEEGQSLMEKLFEGELLKEAKKEVQEYELIELLELFKKEVRPEEIKYFCYHLIRAGSREYKCLWGDKSNDAIYQDARRKRKIIINFLQKVKDLGFTYETVEQFIRTALSEICEELRLKNCKESQKEE
jgi:hypothetical protein